MDRAEPIVRIVLVDDHPVVRAGLRLLLDAEEDIEVVGEAGSADDAVFEARALKPDVILMDVVMPGRSGIEAAPAVLHEAPDAKVLVLSMQDDPRYVREAFDAGASGYVLKSAVDEELVTTCRVAAKGSRFVFPHGISEAVRERVERAAAGDADVSGPLTEREREVLKLIAEGHSGQQIASMLFISEKTVDRHRSNLLDKLDLRDRVDLTRYAIRIGLAEA